MLQFYTDFLVAKPIEGCPVQFDTDFLAAKPIEGCPVQFDTDFLAAKPIEGCPVGHNSLSYPPGIDVLLFALQVRQKCEQSMRVGQDYSIIILDIYSFNSAGAQSGLVFLCKTKHPCVACG
jgi:hypothetical protein